MASCQLGIFESRRFADVVNAISRSRRRFAAVLETLLETRRHQAGGSFDWCAR
jgi:hypothetical protein